jgi:hypothetical protein
MGSLLLPRDTYGKGSTPPAGGGTFSLHLSQRIIYISGILLANKKLHEIFQSIQNYSVQIQPNFLVRNAG